MKDVVGKDINIGDTVAFARRVGNYAELVIRKVVDLEDKDYCGSVKVQSETGRSGWTSPKNLLVIDQTT